MDSLSESQKQRVLAALARQAVSPLWRIRNLYWVRDKAGNEVPFVPNWTQEDFLTEMHYMNLILKARQLGFTTFITLFMLDACLFYPNVHAGIIADTDDKAKEIFRDKIKFAYDRLPPGLRAARSTVVDSVHQMEFDNGSSIQVGTSMRGTTKQYLLVSELGKIAAENPQKAEEIRTGSFNTVHAGQFLFVESTAKGREGLFYDLVEIARKDQQAKRPLTPLTFKFHFYPWYLDESYTLPTELAKTITITKEDQDYFAKVEAERGVELSPEQRAWYVEKRRTQKEEMKAEFPSTPDEPFEVGNEGLIFRHEMALVRSQGRILKTIPWIPTIPVNTFWDLGMGDYTSIWFHQRVGPENRLLRYYENSGYGLPHYLNEIRSHGYVLGKFYLPHDARHKRLGKEMTGKSVEDWLMELGIPAHQIEVVPVLENKWNDGIETTRAFLATCWFDGTFGAQGLLRLENYKKHWNSQVGAWRNEPMHDENSHGADALETGARGYAPPATAPGKRTKRPGRRNFRTV
jgi:hypothetical protein